jgi:hypothetical protein
MLLWERRRQVQDVRKLLPYFTLGYKDSYKGMKGGQSAAACMRYLVGVTKKPHSWVRH